MKILETDTLEIKELKRLVNYHIIESKGYKISAESWRKKFFKLAGKEDHKGTPSKKNR